MNDNQKERIEKAFLEEKERLLSDNKRVEQVVAVNLYLKQFNWAFVYPYVMGGHVNYFATLEKEGRGDKKEVFQIFAKSFFDLKSTTYFIESIFKRRPELEPFCHLIDQSVFMCLQRDYAGAISALLPAIEGSLRHYLVHRRGMSNGRIMKIKDLLNVFTYLKGDYLTGQRNYYQDDYGKIHGSLIIFNEDQVDELVGYKEAFIDMWFGIITEYLEKNLYLDNRSPDFSDGLNRHVIFHGFTGDIYYSLENYLRIFNCVIFLSYAFGMGNGGNFLFDMEDEEILDKWIAFEQIRVVSWTTTEIKAKAYAGYKDFDEKAYSEDIFEDPLGKQFKQMPAWSLEHRLKLVDKLIRKAILKNKVK
ncbi:hypothetical protein Q4E93_13110 [Flavitalea sp. BT771]|uniref:hypothetical protein n=1 Tax=Flavitalea sp. BT771 TaxID=3063329 RepID=UPI0026E264BC|nr:hypothetical protein [Flavitalea sp. BT771]MDO6431537.1 hypothetical protein [Flavitalea sp. BT771]MDV6220445.1 hypothetical protein [Flavitalea sp. BT771]